MRVFLIGYPSELRELIILDDAGQYENQKGEGWRSGFDSEAVSFVGGETQCVRRARVARR